MSNVSPIILLISMTFAFGIVLGVFVADRVMVKRLRARNEKLAEALAECINGLSYWSQYADGFEIECNALGAVLEYTLILNENRRRQ